MKLIGFNAADAAQHWHKRLKEALEADLKRLRESNDSLASDAIKTAEIRGRIAQTKDFLKSIEPGRAVEMKVSNPTYT